MTKRKFLVEIESHKNEGNSNENTYETVYTAKVLEVSSFEDQNDIFDEDATWCEGDSPGCAFDKSLLAVLFEKND